MLEKGFVDVLKPMEVVEKENPVGSTQPK